jgi:hypothetical protein
MSVQFSIDQSGFHRAMATYAMRRNKTDADVVNKAMRYLLPFAAKRVKDKTPPERRILNDLKAHTRNKIGQKFQRKGQWQGTLAAGIIAARLKAKGKLSKKVTPDFWEKVEKMANAKLRSRNYLRAGFIPAFRQFKVPSRAPRGQKKFAGNSKGIKAVPSTTHIAEAYATNKRSGAYKIAPRAFHEAIRDVRRLFLRWLREEVISDAKRSGFF